jgi:hypothetical protein
MRWPTIVSLLIPFILLWAAPLSAGAFEVKFCVPSCQAESAVIATRSEEGLPIQNPVGVFTTTLDFTGANAVSVGGFTITGRAVAQQSGTLQKITFTTPTKVTAPATTDGCPTWPCSIEIIAASAPNDFPLNKPSGGYPAGAVLSGYFLGPQNAYPGIGDSVSMTSQAGGLSTNLLRVLNSDVINATPGGTSSDSFTSLPRSCTGNPGCKFSVTASSRSTSTSIQETVQQQCDTESPVDANGVRLCLTRLQTTLNLSFVTPGDNFNAPLGMVTVDPPDPGQTVNPVALLVSETLPPFGTLKVNNLLVGSNDFALDATIQLDRGASISPGSEEVYLRIGGFTMTIPENSFQRNGPLWTFLGDVAGFKVAGAFDLKRKKPEVWTVGIVVHGAKLTGVPQAPHQVPVDIGVGSDKGSDLVTARFF